MTSLGAPLATAQAPPESRGAAGDAVKPANTNAQFDDMIIKANSAYNSGDYKAAIEHFEVAYRIDPQPNIVYNIARVEEKLGRLEAAVKNYERFIVLDGASPDLRKDALERQKLLQEVLLSRKKSDADALKADDGSGSATDPGATERPGSAGEPADALEVVEDKDTTQKKSVALPASLLVIGGFGLGAAGLVGSQVQDAHASFEDTSNTDAARVAARDRGARLSVTADSLVAVGAITVVVGAVVLIKRMRHNRRLEEGSAVKESASLHGVEFGCRGGALICF